VLDLVKSGDDFSQAPLLGFFWNIIDQPPAMVEVMMVVVVVVVVVMVVITHRWIACEHACPLSSCRQT
jgi:hypothetical protein